MPYTNPATLFLFPSLIRGYSVQQDNKGTLSLWCRIPPIVAKQKSQEGELPSDGYFRLVACEVCQYKESCAGGVDVLRSRGCLEYELDKFQKEIDIEVKLFPQVWRQEVTLTKDEIKPKHSFYAYYPDRENRTAEVVPMLRYIAPNIHPGGGICWGANAGTLHELTPDLRTAYNFFWNSGFNNDLMSTSVLENQEECLAAVRSEDVFEFWRSKQFLWSDRRVLGLAMFHYNQHEEEFEFLSKLAAPAKETVISTTEDLDNPGAVHILEINRGIFRRQSGEIVKGYYSLYGGVPLELNVTLGDGGKVVHLGSSVRWVKAKDLKDAKIIDQAILG